MRPIDGDRLMMHLTDWWYSSFGQAETDESKAIKTVMDKIEQTLGEFALEKQEQDRWIPVSERLPEDEYVLISKKPTKLSGSKWSVGIGIRMADPRSGKIQWRGSGFGVIQDDKVLAWRPLPEAYTEEES